METKHTKGQWEINKYTHILMHKDIVSIKSEDGVDVCLMSNPKSINENAKLIAAAPDLLEALIIAKSLIVGGSVEDWSKINNAIKKVTK